MDRKCVNELNCRSEVHDWGISKGPRIEAHACARERNGGVEKGEVDKRHY